MTASAKTGIIGFSFGLAKDFSLEPTPSNMELGDAIARIVQGNRDDYVTKVIPVAQPFIHRGNVAQLLRSDGFTTVMRNIGTISFWNDRRNQWWCRSKSRLVVYCALKATKIIGDNRKQ